MTHDIDKDMADNDTEREERVNGGFAHETVLELIENDEGQIVLRETSNRDDPLVTIDFSSRVHDMLGSDAQFIGHQMVHAAIQAVMHKQISQWHANVYDEEPEHYS